MTYRLARALQMIGLLIVPVAVAGNAAEAAGAPFSLTLGESLVLATIGFVIFYAGYTLQGKPPG
jgi:hypothetical protein